jgi:probable biosynthetic protein (TIGR04098 family)
MLVQNEVKLGMPNLTYYGLDESWLFKFCGNIHWDLLHEIIDVWGEGERFYASFFHIQLKFVNGQDFFKENDVIHGIFGDHKIQSKIQPITTDYINILGYHNCDNIKNHYSWFFNKFGYL